MLRPHLDELHKGQQRHLSGQPELTARQWEILRRVSAGSTNAQVARALNISPATVRKHLENGFVRLDVASRTEAVSRVVAFLDAARPTARAKAGRPAWWSPRVLTRRHRHRSALVRPDRTRSRDLGGHGMGLHVVQNLDDDVDVRVGEEEVRAGRGVVGVGRLEQPPGVHHPVRGQLLDDQRDETRLLDGELRAVEVVAECLGRGAAWATTK